MSSVKAIFRNGHVELDQSVDWPDGTQVRVFPCGDGAKPLEQWPKGFFDELRQEWGDEPFQRPPQGDSDVREAW